MPIYLIVQLFIYLDISLFTYTLLYISKYPESGHGSHSRMQRIMKSKAPLTASRCWGVISGC